MTLLADATRHQPRARAALAAALATGPSHAFLFRGPPDRASERPRGRLRRSCWLRAPAIPTTPGAER